MSDLDHVREVPTMIQKCFKHLPVRYFVSTTKPDNKQLQWAVKDMMIPIECKEIVGHLEILSVREPITLQRHTEL